MRIIIADGVTHIPSGVFSGMASIREVIVCSSVTSIENKGFTDCSHLRTFTYNGISEIPNDIGLNPNVKIHVSRNYPFNRLSGILVQGRIDTPSPSHTPRRDGISPGAVFGIVLAVTAFYGLVIYGAYHIVLGRE